MSTVTHLTHYFLKAEPAKNVARQTLFNYLKTFADPAAALTAEMLNQFFTFVLNFTYWQSNNRALGESLAADLTQFAAGARLDFSLSLVNFPHLHQLIQLEHLSDLKPLVLEREQALYEAGDQQKSISISENQILIATLKQAGGLEIRVYNRLALVLAGRLKALAPVTELKYNSNLELAQGLPQLLEGPMLTTARFQMADEGCQGLLMRGHILQRYETMSVGPLSQHAELFYGLKRIERFYINPTSDPYYRELASQLERTQHLLQSGDGESRKSAATALQRGKAAVKNIFPNDKLLTVLVTNLEFALMAAGQEPWTQSPNP